MPLSRGTRIGHYEVGVQLGAGGMGEVYRARDPHLGREVALKVLPESCVADPERVARLVREAQTLAALNHPNIAAIHGLERSNGVTALILELVEGPTLADRIDDGPLPVDEALQIAEQVALALEAAHEQGIIHRDVKPSNIKLRPDGTVKVLDFGLAKAIMPDPLEGSSDSRSDAPTVTTPAMSRLGMIMGTAAYMSPEQARGRKLDKRTDVWSFGCVLFEMLTGRRPFPGDEVADVFASILTREPDLSALPSAVPAQIHRLIERCLRKDRRDRLRDIGDARLEIQDARRNPSTVAEIAPSNARRHRRERLAWMTALAIAGAAATYGLLQGRAGAMRTDDESRLEFVAPPTTTGGARAAISPDGRAVAFPALADGRLRLWVRDLASETLRSLPGTDGATYPFWSPDSGSIGFFADNWLKRVDLDGGAVRALAPVYRGTGGTWSRHGVIVFSSLGDPIASVTDTGGEPVDVKGLVQQGSNFYPSFLPDGRRFLYYVRGTADARGVYVGTLDGSLAPRRLIESNGGAVYAAGHVAFVRQRALLAQAFDAEALRLTGGVFTVAPACDCQVVSASSTGTIVYRPVGGGVERRFILFDRKGTELRRFRVNDVMSLPALSKDDTQVLGYRGNPSDGNIDVWSFDLGREAFNRLTMDVGDDVAPVWSPDGARIAFASNRKSATHNIYIKAATSTAKEELLLSNTLEKGVDDWSADGKYILFEERSFTRRTDLMAVTTDGQARVLPVSRTDFEEVRGQFSRDGQWVAYQSDATGRPEIYVQAFPGAGNQKTVSTSGGTQVRWGRDGKELFYITLDGRLMTVPLTFLEADLQIGAPTYLFTPPLGGGVQEGDYRHHYAVAADGKRFLVSATMAPNVTSPIAVIQNWTAGGRSTANGSR